MPQQGEVPPERLPLELHEDVDVALRAEVVAENRAEKRQPPDVMLPAEGLDLAVAERKPLHRGGDHGPIIDERKETVGGVSTAPPVAPSYFSFSVPANSLSGLSSWRTAASSSVVVAVTIRETRAPTPGPSM